MSLKYSNTTADRLDWADMLNLTRKLIQDGNYKIALFITLGSFWGLRVYDMKQLTWLLILDKDEITITEHTQNGEEKDYSHFATTKEVHR